MSPVLLYYHVLVWLLGSFSGYLISVPQQLASSCYDMVVAQWACQATLGTTQSMV